LIVKDLPSTPGVLTFTILDLVAKHLRKGGVRCKTYGDVIEVLEYLALNDAIILEPVSDTQVYKIGKKQYDKTK
jgi:hypothetical protein